MYRDATFAGYVKQQDNQQAATKGTNDHDEQKRQSRREDEIPGRIATIVHHLTAAKNCNTKINNFVERKEYNFINSKKFCRFEKIQKILSKKTSLKTKNC